YIYRTVFEVAESWNRRATEGKNWPATKNYSQAVHMWNKSLSSIKELIHRGEKIICINYEDLLFTDKPIHQLFRMLDLEMDEKVEAQLRSARSRSTKMKSRKGSLTKMEFNFINEHAKMHLLQEFNAMYNIMK
ncbi:MAG: hypothetical protein L3J31_02070, partial [Bacteroidales bacterium]|nr:hypothetical protein [Bacteroidales bacterium]